MSDNARRGLRTIIQVLLSIIVTGGLSRVWETYVSNTSEPIDPTIQVVVGLLLVAVVTWAQATLEDHFGGGILVPEDRIVGDAVLGRGIGAKQVRTGKFPQRYAAMVNAARIQDPPIAA